MVGKVLPAGQGLGKDHRKLNSLDHHRQHSNHDRADEFVPELFDAKAAFQVQCQYQTLFFLEYPTIGEIVVSAALASQTLRT